MHSAAINRSSEIVQLHLNGDDVDPNALFNGKTLVLRRERGS